MKRTILLAAALGSLAACDGGGGGSGGNGNKPSCGEAEPCAEGSYCAHTPDGSVCWPDAVPPVISSFTVTCSKSPCRRDSVLHLVATVADESAMGGVSVAVDLAPDDSRALTLTDGNEYTLDIPLADLPFPYFEHTVNATVTAKDEAGNEASQRGTALGVTRRKWTVVLAETGLSLSSPAILPDGTIVLAGSDNQLHFVDKTGSPASAVAVGEIIKGPPAIGSDGIWLATESGKLLKRASADGSSIPLTECATSTTQQLAGPPAVSGQNAFVGATGSGSRVLLAVRASGVCHKETLPAGVTTAPVLNSAGDLFVATGPTLRSYSFDTSEGTLSERWSGSTPVLPDIVSTGMAIDAGGAVWSIAQNGAVSRTTPTGSTSTVTAVSTGSMGAIVLPDGSAVLSDAAMRLIRMTASGSVQWSTSDTFNGVPAVALALAGTTPSLLVPTSDGYLYLVNQADGLVHWSVQLSSTVLQPANVWTAPGAKTSTAYLAGNDGNLYAIIVDGALDTSAPWPKAFHDSQNTSNAGVAP